ncbi:MAG: hypothetical protein GY811_30885, partial [Myxococcales bacterium]|nr:hypothetical protein [Myxococcales bacterium]
TKIGWVASGCHVAGECVLLEGDELHRTGAIGLALGGNIASLEGLGTKAQIRNTGLFYLASEPVHGA